VGADSRRHAARAAACQLFEEDRLIDDACVRPAVFLVVLQAQQIKCGEAAKEVPRKLLRRLPIIDVRTDLFVDETPDRGTKFVVLRLEEMRARGYACQ
jgi:hypothetical protein